MKEDTRARQRKKRKRTRGGDGLTGDFSPRTSSRQTRNHVIRLSLCNVSLLVTQRVQRRGISTATLSNAVTREFFPVDGELAGQ